MTELPFHYKYIWRLEESVFLLTDARQRQIVAKLFVFFFSPPFALHSSRVRQCCQIVLAWGGTDYPCVQSLITSFRIDYSSVLGSWGVTEEATKRLSLTAGGCYCLYMCERILPNDPKLVCCKVTGFGVASQCPAACLTLWLCRGSQIFVGHTERHVDLRWDLGCS